MSPAIVFDDGQGALGPLTDLRPSMLVRTGAFTTIERLRLLLALEAEAELCTLWVPAELEALAREQTDLPVNDPEALPDDPEGILLFNGRCPVPPDEAWTLQLGAAILDDTAAVVAARLDAPAARRFLSSGSLPDRVRTTRLTTPALLNHPWDVIRFRDRAFEIDLEVMLARETQPLPPGVIAVDDERVRISPEALVYPSVVIDAEQGPVIIDEHATIRPGAILIGPAYIGPGSTVLDRALIKPHTAIGPVCKVAGEVGGTIFQGFANKAHDGHLGDSWVGQWANLGAGTTNSNLLNTYGSVVAQAEPNSPRVRTGLTFLGCIIADHVKLAIMTRVMTGSVFGTGSMIADPAPPTAVGRFEWLTGERRQPFRFEKFLEVARAAMARRKVEPSPAYLARLRALAGA
ncbi:MAG: putative sugar nucleotidyl transferase [Planctomycetota bacterium]|nr:putative sugar nucleotidyl transferase [Planctomycetota bacterium]